MPTTVLEVDLVGTVAQDILRVGRQVSQHLAALDGVLAGASLIFSVTSLAK